MQVTPQAPCIRYILKHCSSKTLWNIYPPRKQTLNLNSLKIKHSLIISHKTPSWTQRDIHNLTLRIQPITLQTPRSKCLIHRWMCKTARRTCKPLLINHSSSKRWHFNSMKSHNWTKLLLVVIPCPYHSKAQRTKCLKCQCRLLIITKWALRIKTINTTPSRCHRILSFSSSNITVLRIFNQLRVL